MDLTDVATKPLNEMLVGCDETATIEGKLYNEYEEYWSGYHDDKKAYYSLPLTNNIWAINYDVDLFDTKSLYKDKNGNWCNLSGDLSVGQDGVEGTYDDGLPVTYTDWLLLLKQIQRADAVPFIWSNQSGYTYHFTSSVFASYEGKENWDAMTNMDGSEYTFEYNS